MLELCVPLIYLFLASLGQGILLYASPTHFEKRACKARWACFYLPDRLLPSVLRYGPEGPIPYVRLGPGHRPGTYRTYLTVR